LWEEHREDRDVEDRERCRDREDTADGNLALPLRLGDPGTGLKHSSLGLRGCEAAPAAAFGTIGDSARSRLWARITGGDARSRLWARIAGEGARITGEDALGCADLHKLGSASSARTHLGAFASLHSSGTAVPRTHLLAFVKGFVHSRIGSASLHLACAGTCLHCFPCCPPGVSLPSAQSLWHCRQQKVPNSGSGCAIMECHRRGLRAHVGQCKAGKTV